MQWGITARTYPLSRAIGLRASIHLSTMKMMLSGGGALAAALASFVLSYARARSAAPEDRPRTPFSDANEGNISSEEMITAAAPAKYASVPPS